jgi:hypothetical protein
MFVPKLVNEVVKLISILESDAKHDESRFPAVSQKWVEFRDAVLLPGATDSTTFPILKELSALLDSVTL